MKNCPYCSYSNYDNATVCRKCDGSFVAEAALFTKAEPTGLAPTAPR